MAQSRLRWYGHAIRKSEGDVVKWVWRDEQEEKRGRGRPEQTWDAVIKRDMESRGLTDDMVGKREEWRLAIRIPTLVKLG